MTSVEMKTLSKLSDEQKNIKILNESMDKINETLANGQQAYEFIQKQTSKAEGTVNKKSQEEDLKKFKDRIDALEGVKKEIKSEILKLEKIVAAKSKKGGRRTRKKRGKGKKNKITRKDREKREKRGDKIHGDDAEFDEEEYDKDRLKCNFCENEIQNERMISWREKGWRPADENWETWMCRECQTTKYYICNHHKQVRLSQYSWIPSHACWIRVRREDGLPDGWGTSGPLLAIDDEALSTVMYYCPEHADNIFDTRVPEWTGPVYRGGKRRKKTRKKRGKGGIMSTMGNIQARKQQRIKNMEKAQKAFLLLYDKARREEMQKARTKINPILNNKKYSLQDRKNKMLKILEKHPNLKLMIGKNGLEVKFQPPAEELNKMLQKARANVFNPKADYYTEDKYIDKRGGKRTRRRKSKRKKRRTRRAGISLLNKQKTRKLRKK